jgi:ABC-2 type transport system permease protein
MAVYRHELRMLRGNVAAWSAAVAVLIFAMLPVYIGFIGAAGGQGGAAQGDQIMDVIDRGAFFQAIGVSSRFLKSSVGPFGFLTTWFFCMAMAINAAHVGLSAHTREYARNTVEFLMTKPVSRARVFFAKLLAGLTGVAAISAAYVLAATAAMYRAVGADFDHRTYWLLAASVFMLTTLYCCLGAFLGAAAPKIRRPLLVAAFAVFVTLIVGAFAQVMLEASPAYGALLYLSPPKFFGGAIIQDMGGYDMKYVWWLWFLVAAFAASGALLFRRRDVMPNA